MMVLLHLFIAYNNCFAHISKDNQLKLIFFKNFELPNTTYDFIFISCLNGKDTFIIRKENEILNYLKFCIYSIGDFQKPLFEIKFYKNFINANEKLKINRIADMLFYRNYAHFFHYYDRKKVEFYRSILRYKIAKIYFENNNFSKALKILSELEKNDDFRIKFISIKLKNEIYKKLNYKTLNMDISVNLDDGIYIKGLDTLIVFENLKVFKKQLVCELDFPEIYIVKNKKLIYWFSPIL
jgi:hypothetical protein